MSNEEKISQWFFEYSDDIYQFLLYKLGSSDVEDLVQEVFIRALKSLKS
ncbi:RNA polymerase sigma factor [Sutcliffiella cohnii]|nr:sigma factor [Sutcliffiella cohnii]